MALNKKDIIVRVPSSVIRESQNVMYDWMLYRVGNKMITYRVVDDAPNKPYSTVKILKVEINEHRLVIGTTPGDYEVVQPTETLALIIDPLDPQRLLTKAMFESLRFGYYYVEVAQYIQEYLKKYPDTIIFADDSFISNINIVSKHSDVNTARKVHPGVYDAYEDHNLFIVGRFSAYIPGKDLADTIEHKAELAYLYKKTHQDYSPQVVRFMKSIGASYVQPDGSLITYDQLNKINAKLNPISLSNRF